MPTPKKGPRLGGSPAHQRLILSNLATALFEHGRITTTEAKARVLRPLAEKLITKAKKAELGTTASIAARREVLKTVRDKSVVHVLFTEKAPAKKKADKPAKVEAAKVEEPAVEEAPVEEAAAEATEEA